MMSLMAMANDGSVYVNGSTLAPIEETDIAVKSEFLTIRLGDNGYASVDVQYVFENRGAARKLQVGFQAEAPYNAEERLPATGIHPYIKDFTVEMNGKRLSYQNAFMEPYKDDENDYDEDFQIGYSAVYYFDADFKTGENRIHHTYRYRTSDGISRVFEVPYWLSPAMAWADGHIGDFTLRIEAPGTAKHFAVPDTMFTLSSWKVVDGVGKIRKTQYWDADYVEIAIRDGAVEWHATDFVPDFNFVLSAVDSFIGYNDDYRVGEFYDRSDNYVVKWSDYDGETLTAFDKRVIRNLPYASRGYVFKDKALSNYFNSLWWYMPDPSYVPDNKDFTEREQRLVRQYK